MSGAYFIELDTTDFKQAEFQEFLQMEGISARLTQPDTGSWPIYRYEGSLMALIRLCTGPYDDPDLIKEIQVNTRREVSR